MTSCQQRLVSLCVLPWGGWEESFSSYLNLRMRTVLLMALCLISGLWLPTWILIVFHVCLMLNGLMHTYRAACHTLAVQYQLRLKHSVTTRVYVSFSSLNVKCWTPKVMVILWDWFRETDFMRLILWNVFPETDLMTPVAPTHTYTVLLELLKGTYSSLCLCCS